MPEGPEVKLLVNKLRKFMLNKTLIKVNILNGRYKKKKPDNWNLLVLPLKISNIDCKGKFIFFEFYDSDIVIFNTLGMSGYWLSATYISKQSENGYYGKKHNNVEFILQRDNLKEIYYFNDMRNFGNIIISDKKDLDKKLNILGVDVLNPANQFNEFKLKLSKPSNVKKEIGLILLDQKVVAGCGNYIRAEVLYLANINPYTKIKDLSEDDIKNIYKYLKKVAYIFYNKKLGIKYGILKENDKVIKMYNNNDNGFLIYMQKYAPTGESIISKKMGERTIHFIKTD
jgi:formamidopyrimidine-DNA glycosylase